MANQESLERNISHFLEQKLDGFAETLADFLAKSVAEQQAEGNEFQNVFSFGKKSTNPHIAEYKAQIKVELSAFVEACIKEYQYIEVRESQEDYAAYKVLNDTKNNAKIALIEKCREVFPQTFWNMQTANFVNIMLFEWGKFRVELLAEKNEDIDNFLEVYGKLFYADGLLHNHAKDTLQIDVLKELGFQQEVIYEIALKSLEESRSEFRRPPPDGFNTDVLSAWDIWNFYKQERGSEVHVEELVQKSEEWVGRASLVSKKSDIIEARHYQDEKFTPEQQRKTLTALLGHADDLRDKEGVAEQELLRVFSKAGISQDAKLEKLKEVLKEVFSSRKI